MGNTAPVPGKKGCGWRLLFRLSGLVIGLILLAGVGAVLAGFLLYQHATQPGVAGEPIKVAIPDGINGRDAGRLLAQKGLIEHELFFRIALRADRVRKPIKQGWYNLPQGLSALELLHVLQKGSNRTPDANEVSPELKVTVAEGLSIEQASKQFAHPAAFVEAASDPKLIKRLGLKTTTLEGFLMPSTYYFEHKPSEREVVERMVAEFEKQYASLAAQTPPPAGRDKLAVVTIASLVEEEARVPEERPSVAAVIVNRLKKNMPLQFDSTVQFALKKHGQRLLYEDLEVDSPYNTYKHAGLPPGPVSSPGAASLKAALRPAQADYLYFVSNADGQTHTFSATEAEHLKAVARFRKDIAPQRKAKEAAEAAKR
jgi:UPF0755 protein